MNKLLTFLVLWGAYHSWETRPDTSHNGPGVSVPDDPIQIEMRTTPALHKDGFTIKPLAEFEVTARVLNVEHYSIDSFSAIAKVDLAVGWGRMSDTAILKRVVINQSGRFFYWRVEGELPIPHEEIVSHSANMHMIAANDKIAKQLKKIRLGQIVKINGYLVEATASDGESWRSSLVRTDSGAGACEIVWVEGIEVL